MMRVDGPAASTHALRAGIEKKTSNDDSVE
jgi:hypothetical protein